jgi:hypothetical protein
MKTDTSARSMGMYSATYAPGNSSTNAQTESRRLSLSKALLSVTASPGVRAITLTLHDKILTVYLYANTAYMAVVGRGVECLINDEELKNAARLLSRLMDRLGAAVKSRYYTYTGPIEVAGDEVRYRPYVSPTSTAEIVLRGGTARVVAGDYKRKFRTRLDVAGVLKRYIEYLKKCNNPHLLSAGDETRLGDG